MAFRNDIDIIINAGIFQDFDKRLEITQEISANLGLEKDDTVWWSCGQFHGMAKIVDYKISGCKHFCTLKKMS